jgi:two-component system response regulator YesN
MHSSSKHNPTIQTGAYMYQALIVDDEKEIREGLSSWDWNAIHVALAGSCANGMEALRFIASNPVDIVITDIRMPFMTGLELMEELNRAYPFIATILLSGYSEFEYARKGIQMGAVDYLLKPVTYSDMADTIRRLTARLDEQNQIQYRMSVLKRKSQQVSKALRREFLDYLFHSPLPPDDIEHHGAEGELLLDADCYSAAVMRMDRIGGERKLSQKESDLFGYALDVLLTRLWDDEGCGYHLVSHESMSACLLCKGRPGRERFEALIRQMLKYKSLFRSTFSIAAGPVVESPAQLHLSMNAARKELPALPENSAFVCPPLQAPEAAGRAEPDGSHDGGGKPDKSDNSILAKARKYIQENYQRSITIKEVAGSVFVSPGYLSSLFKQANEPFLKYLTQLRIRKAKELMEDPKLRIYDVVEMVGYSDPAYFSEIFKKMTGRSPNEYRGHIRPGNDDD